MSDTLPLQHHPSESYFAKMSAISAEQQGLTQEIVELSPEHDSDPIGSAKCIHLTITDRPRNLPPAEGSFAAEIRTSGENGPPDFIINGRSSDRHKGQADVSVTDKSGKVVMTLTRPARHTMQMSYENTSV